MPPSRESLVSSFVIIGKKSKRTQNIKQMLYTGAAYDRSGDTLFA